MGAAFGTPEPSQQPALLPVCLVVTVEVKEDRLAEFLQVIEADAIGSRTEAGCLRFDVLRSQANPLSFTYYEIYRDQAAADVHRTFPHFLKWAEFKESGGVDKLDVVKADGLFLSA